MCSSDIFLGLLAILFPPIAVWIKCGICTADSIINILLCTLGYIPGLIHAWYIISLYPEPSDEYEVLDPEGAHRGERVTYYYVNQDPAGQAVQTQGGGLPSQGYGTVGGGAGPLYQHQTQPQYQTRPPVPQQQTAPQSSTDGIPPSYEQAIQGDNKVQR